MKNIFLLTSALALGVSLSFAQTSTPAGTSSPGSNNGSSPNQINTGTGTTDAIPGQATLPGAADITPPIKGGPADVIAVNTKDIPSGLRTALKNDMYKGWEKSGITQNSDKTEYNVEVPNGNKTKTYHFDKQGRAIVHADE